MLQASGGAILLNGQPIEQYNVRKLRKVRFKILAITRKNKNNNNNKDKNNDNKNNNNNIADDRSGLARTCPLPRNDS